jgi:CxxC motif-containing protein (DUF1111 family)
MEKTVGVLLNSAVIYSGFLSRRKKRMLKGISAVLLLGVVWGAAPQLGWVAEEAPAGFDEQTNGLISQAEFTQLRAVFTTQHQIETGLGPVYNAQSCGECHQSPVAGGVSQVLELRAGYQQRKVLPDPPGGSLIQSRAIHPAIQEQMPPDVKVRVFRATTSTLGSGYVEAIADATLQDIAANQPETMRGEIIHVPVFEAGGVLRIGRFGWKNQHASVLSFAAEASLNEIGITNPFLPVENTANGASVAAYDAVADPEDNGTDIQAFATFMRATKAPERDLALKNTPEARAGELLFRDLQCAVCHTVSMTTARVGTVINSGAFTVPAALGDKIIRPYSDFLLHDVGIGDGIVQNGPPSTQRKLRTAPLWGLRTRNQFMHDGMSLTLLDAISRHRGEAQPSIRAFRAASAVEKEQLLTFLRSL